jgi:hypothetical protein
MSESSEIIELLEYIYNKGIKPARTHIFDGEIDEELYLETVKYNTIWNMDDCYGVYCIEHSIQCNMLNIHEDLILLYCKV